MRIRQTCPPSPGMKIQVSHPGAYAMAVLHMNEGESIRAESGALVTMSDAIKVRPSTGGGVMRAAARRVLAQESFFVTEYTAQLDGAWVALAPPYPGDVEVLECPPEGLIIQSGSFLAGAGTVDISTEFGGVARIAGREGAFVIRAQGHGKLVLSAYGAIQKFILEPRQSITVDTGHFVAASATVDYKVHLLEGFVTAGLSGEGLVARFTGPGKVFVQTRSPRELGSWLSPYRPQNEGGRR